MKISDIELWYVDSIVSVALVNTVGTVLIFAVLKLISVSGGLPVSKNWYM